MPSILLIFVINKTFVNIFPVRQTTYWVCATDIFKNKTVRISERKSLKRTKMRTASSGPRPFLMTSRLEGTEPTPAKSAAAKTTTGWLLSSPPPTKTVKPLGKKGFFMTIRHSPFLEKAAGSPLMFWLETSRRGGRPGPQGKPHPGRTRRSATSRTRTSSTSPYLPPKRGPRVNQASVHNPHPSPRGRVGSTLTHLGSGVTRGGVPGDQKIGVPKHIKHKKTKSGLVVLIHNYGINKMYYLLRLMNRNMNFRQRFAEAARIWIWCPV